MYYNYIIVFNVIAIISMTLSKNKTINFIHLQEKS